MAALNSGMPVVEIIGHLEIAKLNVNEIWRARREATPAIVPANLLPNQPTPKPPGSIQ